MEKNRRKSLIVSNLQYRMLFHTFGLVVGVSILLIIAFIFIFGADQTFAQREYGVFRWIIFIIIALILYFICYITILKLSNRIYGPLSRLSTYLKKLSEGMETGAIRFRKDDVIDGIQEIYNNLCRSFSKTLHYDYNEIVNTFSQLEDILDRIHHKNITEEELYRSLENICSRLAKALDLTTNVINPDDK
ncbi:MAG: hypothetical protein ACUVQ3_04485 [bacterium]